jgi:hypothetical protein
MPEKRLSEIVQALDQQEFNVKLAAIESAYEGDEVRQQLLDEAVDLLKQAEANGEVAPMTDSGMLSAAAQLVEDHIAANTEDAGDPEKTAGAEGADEELSKEAAEELAELGALASEALQAAGISQEDLEKVATEEESEQLGRLAANILLEANAQEGGGEE